MAVRKRRWHTNAQVRALAEQQGIEIDEAKQELARAREEEDAKLLSKYPPQEAWVADYVDGTGKRHIKTFEQKKAADAFAAKTKVDVNAGTHVALHILPRIGKNMKLAKLTRGHVERFRDDLLTGEKKLSPVMARKVWVSFKSMLKNEYCSHLADNVRISTSKRNKRKLEVGRDIPTPDEVRRLIQASANKPKLCTLLKVAACVGLRASELRGLRWSDVDLKSNELHVRQRADRFGE